MEREFRLPDIGEGLTEAEIVRWLIPEGGQVEADQGVVEVETDKAVVEIPSPYKGVVVRHGGAEGEVIEVGSVLVVIGEESPASEPGADATPELSEPEVELERAGDPMTTVAPIVGTLSEEAEILVPSGGHSDSANMVKALPVVRKLARDRGVDLAAVTGSGPQGRITREDVLAAVPSENTAEANMATSSTEASSPAPPAPERPIEGSETRPMSRLRRTIAANMAQSWREIPHVTTFDDVDASRLLDVRSALGTRHGVKIPLEALVVKAVLPALDEFPDFNATLDGDNVVLHGRHDIGIAVDTPDGLLVAVIKDAAGKGVIELAGDVERLGRGAKERKLSPEELTGQTFTVSNIGAVGGGHGTPIVPHGTTAILSVGRAREKPLVVSGDLVIALVMPLSLSYDHRVIDGGQGRRFMARVIENLEEPALFLAG